MTSLVSIIIPTYNRASLIGDTIESLIHQTYHTIEIIIIDDHSTDNTEFIVNELIKKDKRISYHKRPINKPKGANACRNYGFSISKGEYVKWIDSDDVLVPEAIEKQLSVLINPEADLCICRTKIFSKYVETFLLNTKFR
jgi:glycosyltransferase involved in cell wall biosynthesis